MNRRERRQSCKSLRPRLRAWSCPGCNGLPCQTGGKTAGPCRGVRCRYRWVRDGSGTRLHSGQVQRPPRPKCVRGAVWPGDNQEVSLASLL